MGKPKFHNPVDPRTATVADLKIGHSLRDSKIKHIKPQRKGGKNGLRVTLEDHRSAWGVPAQWQRDLAFTRRS